VAIVTAKLVGRMLAVSAVSYGFVVGMTSGANAQWIALKTPGIPRTADGKPNLMAPAPRQLDKPDLGGLWRVYTNGYANNVTTDLRPDDIERSAAVLYQQHQENLLADDPSTARCLPSGPRAFYQAYPTDLVRIVQTRSEIVMMYEDLSYRQIFMDGRELPKEPNPSFMGYSVGRWQGDTLVVESVGFNDKTWLDYGGHPHSESLRVTERIKRTDFGHLAIEVTFDDPTYYRHPWTIPARADFAADTEMIEYVCNENEKDVAHMVGKASDVKKVAVVVAPDVLARYVGTYAFSPSDLAKTHITLTGGTLFFDVGGKDKRELIPLSESTFSMTSGVRLEFRSDRVIFHLLERDTQALKDK
jgi:hypothetical protein